MRRGRVDDGCLTEAQAHERMLALVREHDADQTLIEQDSSARERRGVTFREVAPDYLAWLADVRGAKPSTLRALRSELTEPGIPHLRGTGHTPGWIMGALGDRPAREVTTREINLLLRKIASTGVSPRTVNKARQLIHAVFNYGMRPHTWGLTENPTKWADRRREPEPGPLPYYSVEQIEALARAFESGAHRDPRAQGVGEEELAARAEEDSQDAELVRVAAYSGLRQGELVALRWRDVQFLGRKLVVSRTLSGDVESNSTKSGRFREVPLPDQAAGALDRLTPATATSGWMSTSSATASAAGSIRQRCGLATTAPATPLACLLCGSTTSATPTARCSWPAALTSSRSSARWAIRRSGQLSVTCTRDPRPSSPTGSRRRSAASAPSAPTQTLASRSPSKG